MTDVIISDSLEAITIIEEEPNSSEERQLAAWQYLLDTGLVWQLQGFYGRTATRMIEAGLLTPKQETVVHE